MMTRSLFSLSKTQKQNHESRGFSIWFSFYQKWNFYFTFWNLDSIVMMILQKCTNVAGYPILQQTPSVKLGVLHQIDFARKRTRKSPIVLNLSLNDNSSKQIHGILKETAHVCQMPKINYAKLILFMFTLSGLPYQNLLIKPSFATETTGMVCVTQHCTSQLSKCLSDSDCSKGLGCFVACAAKDSIGSTAINKEGSCQVRCMDLHENELLNEFTECSLTQNRCYAPLKADVRYVVYPWFSSACDIQIQAFRTNQLILLPFLKTRYPRLPPTLLDERLSKSSATTSNEISHLLRGRWYITAGLNPTFDTFDCQIHEFSAPENILKRKLEGVVAIANFSYRVPLGNNEFSTKNAPKSLQLIKDEPFNSVKNVEEPIFEEGKKWGIEPFSLSDRKGVAQPSNGYNLQLTLRPNQMNYKDNWYILSYSTDVKYGFITLAYRGCNSAWDGYGGLNIYTRSPYKIDRLVSTTVKSRQPGERAMVEGINAGLLKVGLSLNDLVQVDNSCRP